MARQVLPVVGTIVGAYFGMPQLGWMIGAAIGNAVDPQVIKGPGVGDIGQQTSQEGGPRPFGYGLSQPIAGNVIATSEPKIVKKKQSQGKGGPKVETESVYRTYAIGVYEGPIFGFVRVWRNGILVYDARNGNTPDNAKWLDKARFFLGTYDQNASPDLEAIFGVGETPAHRGTAYMVMADDDLTDFRGAIPQYMFQVAVAGGLDCEELTQYSNEVMYDWLDADYPLNPENDHIISSAYDGNNGVSGPHASVEAALSHIESVRGKEFHYTGYDKTNSSSDVPSAGNTLGYTNRMGAVHASVTRTPTVGLHYNSQAPADVEGVADSVNDGANLYAPYNSGVTAHINDTTGGADATQAGAVIILWNDDGFPIPDGYDNATTDGLGTYVFSSCDARIEVDIVPRAPNNPCEPRTGIPVEDPDFPGYCIIDGKFVESSPWVEDVGEWKVMRKGIYPPGPGSPYTLPLNPARPIGHADYNSQAFWEAAYDAHVLAGRMAPGLVYGTDYPEEQGFGYIRTFESCELIPGATALRDVVEDLAARAGALDVVDASALVGAVRGFTVTNQYPCYAALQALSQIFLFDPSNRDAKVAFVHRGANSVATITEEDMVENDDQSPEGEGDKRADPIAIPRVMHLNYHDIEGGLATDKQSSERAGDRRAVGEASLQSAVILSADEAARVVHINHKVGIEDQKGELTFQLPDSWLELTTADVVIVQYQGKSVRCRITKCDTGDGLQDYVLLRDRQSAYTSNVEGIPAAPQTPPPSGVVGPTLLQILDIKLLRDVDDNVGLAYYVAVAGILGGWQGATVELSVDGGANYIDGASTSVAAVIGELLTELPDHPQAYPDLINSCTVRLDTFEAELEETDLEGLYNGENLAIVGDEIIAFAVPDEQSEGVWELSTFLRGRKGTATQAHAIGERFVLLDRGALNLIPADLVDIGRTLTFRATSHGTTPGVGSTVVSILFAGEGQTERQVGYLMAHRDGTDMVVEWQGVGRLGAGTAAAHGTRFDGYRVTFDDGVAAPVVVDTLAQTLTHDVSGLASPVTITVEQMNALTGAGPAAEVIVT